MEYQNNEYNAIKREVLKDDIAKMVARNIDCIDLDFNNIATTKAIVMLDEIRNVLINETNNLKVAEEIRKIFNKNNISHTKSPREKLYDALLQKNT